MAALPATSHSIRSSNRALADDCYGDSNRYTLESQKPGAFYAKGEVKEWIPSPSLHPNPSAVTIASDGSGLHNVTVDATKS